MSDLPRKPIELVARPAAAPVLVQRLRALRALQLVVRVGDTVTRCPLQVGERNAVLAGKLTLQRLDPETIVWRDRASAAGGTFTSNSIALANALIVAVKASNFNAKILYLLPLFGGNLATARVPLRDFFGVGIAGNHGAGTVGPFTEGQFSQATGLQNITAVNSGSILDLKVLTSQLSGAALGGLGYWERNAAGAFGSYVMGYMAPGSSDYVLAFDAANEYFAWGQGFGDVYSGAALGNHHYYGQRNAGDDRKLFRNGVLAGSNTSAASTSQMNNAHGFGPYGITLMGLSGYFHGYFYSGRCGVAYLTDGTLTDGEVAQLHTILAARVITATGR